MLDFDSSVTSQSTGWLELKIMFLELLPQIYHYCSKLSGENFQLSAEENFHHERAKHMTIYEIQKQLVYHIQDISLMILVLIVSKILYFFSIFPTAYNTGYCLSTEFYFAYILYGYTMAMLFLKKLKVFWGERAAIPLEM